jgi:hypothetical protein
MERRGAVYVFTRGESSWIETAELVATDAAPGDAFGGSALSIDGNLVLVGAEDDDDAGMSSGSAYLFEWTGSDWVERTKLVASDARTGDGFGCSVSISGSTALIGAAGRDGSSSNEGSAYVFEPRGDSCVQVAELSPGDPRSEARFGTSVAVSGSIAVAGAPGDGDELPLSGTVYVFERDAHGAWGPHESIELHASDAGEAEEFGWQVAVSGQRVLVASVDDELGPSSGSVYVFERKDSRWEQVAKLTAPDGSGGDLFGRSVALDGDCALVGAVGDDVAEPSLIGCNSGSAYFVRVSPSSSFPPRSR